MATMPENSSLTLAWLARGRAYASIHNAEEAEAWLVQRGHPRAARLLVKGPIAATGTQDSDTAAMIGAWSQSMSSASAFYKLLDGNSFRRMPLHQRIGLATSRPTAAVVGEGRGIPISRAVISSIILQPITVGSMLVCTKEMLFDPGAEGLFNKELKSVVGEAVDAAFVAALFDGSAAITVPSGGSAAADALNDVRGALLALGPVGDASRIWALAAPDVAIRASTLGAEGGGVFPSMTPSGGQLRGMNTLVSNGIPAGSLAIFDAMQVAAAGGTIDIRVSTQSDVEMSDSPASDATVPTGVSLVSMFESNCVAMRATAMIAAQRLRDDCCVLIENINWGGA